MKSDPLGWMVESLRVDSPRSQSVVPAAGTPVEEAAATPRRGDPAERKVDSGVQRLLSPGDRVQEFRVMRPIGRGGMGEVYLARDTVLGRKVAIKVIKRQALPGDGALDRFLFEARAAARFSHPNIVTIYSAGDHEGRPYVAMEYLEGQNLRTRLREDPPGPRESLGIALAVAKALQEAHAHKILHRDLKPENLLIPHDGRVRVVDFGLARFTAAPLSDDSIDNLEQALDSDEVTSTEALQLDDGAVRGSPPYMAPEQWLHKDDTGATDIWALGILLHELLTGERPYERFSLIELAAHVMSPALVPLLAGGGDHGPLPDEQLDLMRRCLAKEAADRPTAAEAVSDLRAMLHNGPVPRREGEIPFRGLSPFTESHADVFFGRDAEILEFMERVRERAVLPVVGPSGAGKSSFVQAAVIPRLRDHGDWLVLRMRPGDSPFRALAARLAAGETRGFPSRTTTLDGQFPGATAEGEVPSLDLTLAEEEGLAEELEKRPHMLGLALRRLAAQEGAKILLFIDQLEELVTLVEDGRVRQRFMEAICGAADDPDDPLRVIFTLREDFLSRLSRGPLVRVAMGQVTVMHRPERRALEQTLTRPAEAMGYAFEDDSMVHEMVAEVEGERSALPLLQFAARQLWERRDRERKVLTREAYEKMGRVAGALAAHADGLIKGMSAEEVAEARELLLRLVTAEGTRRVISRADLLEGRGPEAQAVLGRLTAARLLTTRRGTGTGGGRELVHESLITSWRRLARWIEESREDLVFLQEASRAAGLWDSRGRRHGEVWTGKALVEAEGSLSSCTASVPDLVRRFIAAGRRYQDRKVWRLRAGGVALLLSMIVLSLIFYSQREEAEEQREQAVTQRAAARLGLAQSLREGARAALANGRRLEARARLRSALEVRDSVASRALWFRLDQDPTVWVARLGASLAAVAFSPDGEQVAAACQDRAVYLLDRRTRATRVLRGFTGDPLSLAFHPREKMLAVGTSEGHLHLRDLSRGSERILRDHKRELWRIAISPDGKRLATATNKLVLRNLAGGKPLWQAEREEGAPYIVGLAFSPDGQRVATGDRRGLVVVRRAADGAELRRMRHGKSAHGLTFSPDGKLLAWGGTDNVIHLRNAHTGAAAGTLRGHHDVVLSLAFSPDGRRLLSGSNDRTVRVWDLESRQCVRVLRGHKHWIVGLSLDRTGRYLATAGYDSTARLWNLSREEPPSPMGGHSGGVDDGVFQPGGRFALTASYDGTARLWNVADGTSRALKANYPGRVRFARFSADGRSLAIAGEAGVVQVYDTATLNRKARLRFANNRAISGMDFHPDGKVVAAATSGSLRLWDIASGAVLLDLPSLGTKNILSLAFSPDGRTLALGVGSEAVHLLTWPGAEVRRVLTGLKHSVSGLSFGPRGERLAAFCRDGTIHVWPLAGGAPQVIGPLSGELYSGQISADGQVVGAPVSDGTARLFSLDGKPLLTLRGHRDEVNSLAFPREPGNFKVLTTSDDGTVRLWDRRDGRPLWNTRLLFPSPPAVLTHRGWEALNGEKLQLPGDKAWARAVAEGNRVGYSSRNGRRLCILDRAGTLSYWDTSGDRLLWQSEVADVQEAAATDNGCLLLAGGEARIYGEKGSYRRLAATVQSVSWQPPHALVLTRDRVLTFDTDGQRTLEHNVGPGVTAAMLVDGRLALGFKEGNIELHTLKKGRQQPVHAFEGVPASPVVRLMEGPSGTLVAGFANGVVGLWDRHSGERLHQERLHGPVLHLLLKDRKLHVASELGDHVTLNLAPFYMPYKELLKQVRSRVPVIWKDGQARLAFPPQ